MLPSVIKLKPERNLDQPMHERGIGCIIGQDLAGALCQKPSCLLFQLPADCLYIQHHGGHRTALPYIVVPDMDCLVYGSLHRLLPVFIYHCLLYTSDAADD